MVQSLKVQRSLERMRKGLVIAAIAQVALAALLAVVVPDHPWLSAVIGGTTGVVMLLISYATTLQSAKSEVPHVGWISVDYVAKIALVGGALAAAKIMDSLNLYVVAGLVLFGILASMVVQGAAFFDQVTQTSSQRGM